MRGAAGVHLGGPVLLYLYLLFRHFSSEYINCLWSYKCCTRASSAKYNLFITSLKSQKLIFGKHSHKIGVLLNVTLNGKKLIYVLFSKNIGLHLDTDVLKWQSRYSSSKMLFSFPHFLKQPLKVKLTPILISSKFNYCETVYSPCLGNLSIKGIQIVQELCLHFVYGTKV